MLASKVNRSRYLLPRFHAFFTGGSPFPAACQQLVHPSDAALPHTGYTYISLTHKTDEIILGANVNKLCKFDSKICPVTLIIMFRTYWHLLATVAFIAGAGFVPRGQAATGTIRDVQHVVILTMENRSFDHYFGCFPGVRGYGDPTALVFPDGSNVFAQPQGTNFVWPMLCNTQCIVDVAHDWTSGHVACNNGNWNQWVIAKGQTAMPYFARSFLPLQYALAEEFTICDNYHCSVLGPTLPNRLYQMTGTIDPHGLAGGPVTNNYVPTNGFTWTTYPERLQSNSITWKVYQQDYWSGNPLIYFAQYMQSKPGDPLYDRGIAAVTNVLTAFADDVRSNTLPQVSWLVPSWALSEHPALSPSEGAALIEGLLNALASNPAVYNSTVFFLTYDENGGFFDHLPSPLPPPGTPDEFVGDPIGLGARVPFIIISPWTRGGYVCSQSFDHTSLLRFLEAWTGVREPNISAWRRQVSSDLTSAFDFANPNTNFPSLPSVNPFTCTMGVVMPIPDPQVFPAQESGIRPARPLPYQLDGDCIVDATNGALIMVWTNSGCASAHVACYANAYRTDGPWQLDVSAGTGLSNSLEILTNGGGYYDITGYGPNGFLRRFAGFLQTTGAQFEVASTIDATAPGITLVMTNPGAILATFTVSNGYAGGGPWVYPVAPGQSAADTFLTITNNGWYDLRVSVDLAPEFLRRLAGHIETGYVAPRLQFGPPILSATCVGTGLELCYSASAAGGFVLEWTPDFVHWAPVTNTPTVFCDRAAVTVPMTPQPGYFRLRK